MATRKVLVTGVSGFVGKALAHKLNSLGYSVTGVSRSDPGIPFIKFVAIDLANPTNALQEALSGVEGVFHTAAKVDMWGRYQDFYGVNVGGTENLLSASQRQGVQSFIFTSSPSVVAGEQDLCGIDESYPYPSEYHAHYPATKALAEQRVLKAASPGFRTCALRPHLIYGPGDRNFAPLILARARAGRLRQVGNGKNLVDFSFIDDCVAAHINAFDTLHATPEQCNGKAYFISQGEPYPLWQWIRELLGKHGLELPSIAIPPTLARGVASLMESASKLSAYRYKPMLTTFLIHQMTTSHYFSIEAAKRDLGYRPTVGVREGLER